MGIGAVKPRARAVFLDRDGVLNRAIVRNGKPYPPATAAEMELQPDAERSLIQLKKDGFLLLVVTNQPDVARGTQTTGEVEAIHERIRSALPVDEFLVCYHDDSDGCECRKPKPGLLLEAAQRYGLDLKYCFLIGDRWRDIDAAHAAGCPAVWIDYHYQERGPTFQPEARVSSLEEAVAFIMATAQAEIKT
jgi:D-glycero-D-manno-heptose 1,7-bisphosphate phosphatase